MHAGHSWLVSPVAVVTHIQIQELGLSALGSTPACVTQVVAYGPNTGTKLIFCSEKLKVAFTAGSRQPVPPKCLSLCLILHVSLVQ